MKTRSVDNADVEVVVRGDLPSHLAEYARQKVTRLAARLADRVLHARIRLTRQPDPAVARPVRVQAQLNLNGRLARAEGAGVTGEDAVDLVVDRLRRRLTHLKRHWEARRGGLPVAEPHEWRHGSEPSRRPPYYPRPVEERRIVRHRSFAQARMSQDLAAWEMHRLDYGFHLFTEAATGGDAVIYRGGSTGYRLARLESGPKWLGLSNVPITLSPHPAPTLTVAEARRRLETSGLPFVFFADAETGRGSVLYHRYDGHYGLVTPSQ